MPSIHERSSESSPVLVLDPVAEDLIGAGSRLGVAHASPRSARTAGGKSLVPFWRRWWRSI
jgi:hypothetical protein